MSKIPIYCEKCKKTYNIPNEDLNLMVNHYLDFNGKVYKNGCFFKDLVKLKNPKKVTKFSRLLNLFHRFIIFFKFIIIKNSSYLFCILFT